MNLNELKSRVDKLDELNESIKGALLTQKHLTGAIRKALENFKAANPDKSDDVDFLLKRVNGGN